MIMGTDDVGDGWWGGQMKWGMDGGGWGETEDGWDG